MFLYYKLSADVRERLSERVEEDISSGISH